MTDKPKFPSTGQICVTILVLVCVAVGLVLKDLNGCLKFVDAAGRGDVQAVRRSLDSGTSPDLECLIGGNRAIARASVAGQIEVVRLLLDKGANPTYGLGPAISTDRVDIVKLLIRAGADVNQWKGYEHSPLQWAKERPNPEIIAALKKAGAK